MSKKKETARRTYIRILASGEEGSPDEVLAGELIEAGYLRGSAPQDENGIVRDATIVGITAQGRLFLQKLKAEEEAESIAGAFKKHGSVLAGALVGAFISVASTVASDLIKSWISHSP